LKLTEKVKKIALENGLDYVGVARAESLRNEPEYHRPSDFLPGAQSVISLGVKISKGVQLANKIAHLHPKLRHAIFPYLWQGFGLPSLHFVDRTAVLITRFLEKEGFLAVPAMSASTFDVRSSLTEFSNIHAAVAAGLGELGWCDLLLTPDVGPRVRLGSIITTAKLDPDPMYEGERLCKYDKCDAFNKSDEASGGLCPTKAIGPQEERVVIQDKVFMVARIDSWRCTWGSMGLSKEAGGLKDIPMPEQVGPDEVFEALKHRDPAQSMELMVIGRGDYCGKCIIECPIGRSGEVDQLMSEVRES
jgi:hypothetical protein